MTIRELQDQVRELKARQGWDHTTLTERLRFLRGEIDELSTEVLLLADLDAPGDRGMVQARLGHEIYDVLWNLCALADLAGIDLEAALAEKHVINQQRRWGQGE